MAGTRSTRPRGESTRRTATSTGSPSRTVLPVRSPISAVPCSLRSHHSPRIARAGRKPSNPSSPNRPNPPPRTSRKPPQPRAAEPHNRAPPPHPPPPALEPPAPAILVQGPVEQEPHAHVVGVA